MHTETHRRSPFLFAASALAITLLIGHIADAALFQHLDASVADSVIDDGGTITWLDQSGNGRDAVDDLLGGGVISLSTDRSVFPSERDSIDFDTIDLGRARMQLLDVDDAATLFDQSPGDAHGFSVFVAVRGEGGSDWNDLIGTSTIVNDGFLMRWRITNGRFQTSVDAPDWGNGTAQNNMAGQDNYSSGEAMVLGMNYDPEFSEITLASTLNDYSQTFGGQEPEDFSKGNPLWLGSTENNNRFFDGQVGEVKIYDAALTAVEFADELAALGEKWLGEPVVEGGLEAGDANMDLQFNQLDLVQVQISAKYLTGQPATWGEGDWDGAPGGSVGAPPPGDGVFNQVDIIAALAGGKYLTGPYASLAGSPQADVIADLTVIGSLAGGGGLGPVDLVYVPEPTAVVLLLFGVFSGSLIPSRPPRKSAAAR